MTPEAEKALEEKARSLFAMLDSNLGVAIEVSSVWEIRQRIIAALREVAEQARREEAADWGMTANRVIDELASDAQKSSEGMLFWNGMSAGAIWMRDEILRRRGVKP